jgi:ATP-dependent Clp protease ATP-binding subunit ClpC
MFERYTEKARRVIFFARYEASQFGIPTIETEHLLLGVLREDKTLTHRLLSGSQPEAIRKQIEDATTKGQHIATSVDLPLSNESKRVLAYAAEEAERLAHRHIGTEHLLLGLLREEHCFAATLLREHGVMLSAVREQLAKTAPERGESAAAQGTQAPASKFTVDLTQQAGLGQLRPVVGREKEMDRLTHILGRSTKKNAVLVGEPGVGKRAIVEGLAQRIASGNAPPFLAGKVVIELDLASVKRHTTGSYMHVAGTANIFFMDAFHTLLAAESAPSDLLKAAILGGHIQCICSATPEEYRRAREKNRWLDRCFRAIEVPPATVDETIAVLLSAKDRLEKFHSIIFTDDAIRSTAHYAAVYIKDRNLPDKALDLMDEAAAYVNSRPTHWPPEIIGVHKRIKMLVQDMENAIANHEFEKARSFSDQERKEREKLRELMKKHGIPDPEAHQVTREDVEEVLARWTGIPVSTIRRENPGGHPETTEN